MTVSSLVYAQDRIFSFAVEGMDEPGLEAGIPILAGLLLWDTSAQGLIFNYSKESVKKRLQEICRGIDTPVALGEAVVKIVELC